MVSCCHISGLGIQSVKTETAESDNSRQPHLCIHTHTHTHTHTHIYTESKHTHTHMHVYTKTIQFKAMDGKQVNGWIKGWMGGKLLTWAG